MENTISAPMLKTTRFAIRPFRQCDLKTFAEYRSDNTVSKYQSWTDYTLEEAKSLFASMDYTRFGSIGQWFQLAIISSEHDKLVGDIAVHFIDHKQVEIGFTVSPAFQGQGVASEAVSTCLQYLFGELNIHRVIAVTDVRNIASCGLLEKLAFRREGHFIQNVFFKGEWGDEYLYAMLKKDCPF